MKSLNTRLGWKVPEGSSGLLKKGSTFKFLGDGLCLADTTCLDSPEILLIANYYHNTGTVGSVILKKYFGDTLVEIGLMSDGYYGVISIKNSNGSEIPNAILCIYRWLPL